MRDMLYDNMMVEFYRENPDFALERINSVFEDGDEEDFISVLRYMAKAFEGKNADDALQENRISCYREIVKSSRRHFETLPEGLRAIGLTEGSGYEQALPGLDKSMLIDKGAPNDLGVRAAVKAPRFAAEICKIVRASGLNPLHISRRIEGASYDHIRRVIKGENFPGTGIVAEILRVLGSHDRLEEFRNLLLQDREAYKRLPGARRSKMPRAG